MRRGRPRHNDVLTPREWDVLDLLRHGLTNEQIAARLGISLDTAKFHVSEILGKLGVRTRQQAAAWQGRPRVIPAAGLPAAIAGKIGALSPLKLAGAAVLAAAALGLAALTAGLLLTDSNPRPGEQTIAPDGRTGDEAVDSIIESLLRDDDAAMARRFAGVTAREGAVMGGPVGIYQPRTVPAADWTARLGTAGRRLHAVVKDPREPFDWWMQSPQPSPRAAVFAEERDYDIILVVEAGDTQQPWRFSLRDGDVVDVVIDAGEPGRAVSLQRRLADLTPSPDDEPSAFLVLPPDSDRLPPAQPGTTGAPNPANAPVSAPTFAPDGRTGDAKLDALIETLLTADIAALRRDYADLVASQEQPVSDPNAPGRFDAERVRVTAADWIDRFAGAQRSLHAVFTDDPVDLQVLLAVDAGGPHPEAWRFGIENGRVEYLHIALSFENVPRLSRDDDALERLTPGVRTNYFRFYVLPPAALLPEPPAVHATLTRTGDPEVDRILALFESRDTEGLIDLSAGPDQFVLRHCNNHAQPVDAGFVSAWARESGLYSYRLHAVVNVPRAWDPSAEHVLILVRESNPYDWIALGIYERDGRIVGVSDNCQPSDLYPPGRLLAGPSGSLDRSRRSGIPAVDAVIDALQGGNATALESLIDYGKVPCSNVTGVGAPPKCPDGVAPGTPVDALERGCEGYYYVPPTAAAALIRNIGGGSLYALVERPQAAPGGPPIYAVTLDQERGAAYTLLIEGGRIIRVETTCPAPVDTIWQVRGEPDFLLPPP